MTAKGSNLVYLVVIRGHPRSGETMEGVGKLDPDHAEEHPGRIADDPRGTNVLDLVAPSFSSSLLGVDVVGLDVQADLEALRPAQRRTEGRRRLPLSA